MPREAGVMMFHQTASVRDAANQYLQRSREGAVLAVDDPSRTREMNSNAKIKEDVFERSSK